MRASERAAHLTKQLLAYAGKGRFVLQAMDLSDAVREISHLIKSSIPKNAQLRLDLAEKLPCIEADASQIQQLVMNLVINAAEAIPEDRLGNVLVTTRHSARGRAIPGANPRHRAKSRRANTSRWRSTTPASEWTRALCSASSIRSLRRSSPAGDSAWRRRKVSFAATKAR